MGLGERTQRIGERAGQPQRAGPGLLGRVGPARRGRWRGVAERVLPERQRLGVAGALVGPAREGGEGVGPGAVRGRVAPLVGVEQLAQDQHPRAAVDDRVVVAPHQPRLGRAEPAQHEPHQGWGGGVEAGGAVGPQQLGEALLLGGAVAVGPVQDHERHLDPVLDPQRRGRLGAHGEAAAQGPVAGHRALPRPAQRRDVDRLVQPDDGLLEVRARAAGQRFEDEAGLHRRAGEVALGHDGARPSRARVSSTVAGRRPATAASCTARSTSCTLVAGTRSS